MVFQKFFAIEPRSMTLVIIFEHFPFDSVSHGCIKYYTWYSIIEFIATYP